MCSAADTCPSRQAEEERGTSPQQHSRPYTRARRTVKHVKPLDWVTEAWQPLDRQGGRLKPTPNRCSRVLSMGHRAPSVTSTASASKHSLSFLLAPSPFLTPHVRTLSNQRSQVNSLHFRTTAVPRSARSTLTTRSALFAIALLLACWPKTYPTPITTLFPAKYSTTICKVSS